MELLVMASRFVSISKYARIYDWSEITVRRRIKDGTVLAVQPGGPGTSWRIRIDDHADASVSSAPTPLSPINEVTDQPKAQAKSSKARQPQWIKKTTT